MYLLNSFVTAATIAMVFFDIQRTYAKPINDEVQGRFLFFRERSTPAASTARALIGETKGIPRAATSATFNLNSITTPGITREASPISKVTKRIENSTTIAGISKVTVASLSTSNRVIANKGTVSFLRNTTLPPVTVPSSATRNTHTANSPKAAISANGTTGFIVTTLAPESVSILGRKDVKQNSSETDTVANSTTTTEKSEALVTSPTTGDSTTMRIANERNIFDDMKNQIQSIQKDAVDAIKAIGGIFTTGHSKTGNKSQTQVSAADTTPTTKSDVAKTTTEKSETLVASPAIGESTTQRIANERNIFDDIKNKIQSAQKDAVDTIKTIGGLFTTGRPKTGKKSQTEVFAEDTTPTATSDVAKTTSEKSETLVTSPATGDITTKRIRNERDVFDDIKKAVAKLAKRFTTGRPETGRKSQEKSDVTTATTENSVATVTPLVTIDATTGKMEPTTNVSTTAATSESTITLYSTNTAVTKDVNYTSPMNDKSVTTKEASSQSSPITESPATSTASNSKIVLHIFDSAESSESEENDD